MESEGSFDILKKAARYRERMTENKDGQRNSRGEESRRYKLKDVG